MNEHDLTHWREDAEAGQPLATYRHNERILALLDEIQRLQEVCPYGILGHVLCDCAEDYKRRAEEAEQEIQRLTSGSRCPQCSATEWNQASIQRQRAEEAEAERDEALAEAEKWKAAHRRVVAQRDEARADTRQMAEQSRTLSGLAQSRRQAYLSQKRSLDLREEEVDRNARAFGWEVGKGHPLVEMIVTMSPKNPFLDPNWRERIGEDRDA